MIGIGSDLLDIRRIEKTISRFGDRFKNKIFTKNEINKCEKRLNKFECYAKRFAAKEAVMKSLGKGWRQLSWKDIEISGGGKPEVILYGKAKELASELNIENVHVSLSHEEDKAIAFTISEIEE